MINLHQNKGFALAFALIFFFLIVSFMAVYVLAVASAVSQANSTANLKKAYYAADTGLLDAYERVTQAGVNTVSSSICVNPNIPSSCASPYIPSNATDNGVYAIGSVNGSYKVSIQYFSSPRANYIITSTGTYLNASKTLQLKIIGAAISKYAYWSTTEINQSLGGALWWVGMPGFVMLTDGPVQTNGQLNIFGNPIFNSPVTEANLSISGTTLGTVPTSSTPNYYYGTSATPGGDGSDPNYIFQEGITNQAPAIDLPPQQTLNGIKTTASAGGLVLTGTSQVIFNPTGTITVTGKVKNSLGVVTATYTNKTMTPPANGVIYVQSNSGQSDGNVTVQGTVSGQLTVAADQNIYLSGSVQYNDQPVRPGVPGGDPNSTDMLGLVANQNITVIEADAPTQLEIEAVMVALQGSFQVDQYGVYRGNATTAVMDQFGSLINFECGATGEMDMSGNLLGGWNQIQSYDSRLGGTMALAPPGFPPYTNNAGNAVYSKYLHPQAITECVSGVCG